MNSADRKIHEREGKRLVVRGGLGVVDGIVGVGEGRGGDGVTGCRRGRYGSGGLIFG